MPRIGLEPTITVFELAKAVYALNRAATVIDYIVSMPVLFIVISQHLRADACITARKIQMRMQISRLIDQLLF
jgi:hypothetical protein